jgi:hypothetical protein
MNVPKNTAFVAGIIEVPGLVEELEASRTYARIARRQSFDCDDSWRDRHSTTFQDALSRRQCPRLHPALRRRRFCKTWPAHDATDYDFGACYSLDRAYDGFRLTFQRGSCVLED